MTEDYQGSRKRPSLRDEAMASEDYRKLHAEVNQIVNQRFLVTTLALTTFGVLGAWGIPRPGISATGGTSSYNPAVLPEASVLTLYLVALIMNAVLLVLFLYSHTLRRNLRFITAYLRVVGGEKSWEAHWRTFRRRPDPTWMSGIYARPQAWVFVALHCLGMIYPVVFSLILNIPPPLWPTVMVLVFSGFNLFIVRRLGFDDDEEANAKFEREWSAFFSDEERETKVSAERA